MDRYIEVRQIRAKDLTDRDVARINGTWRLVADVFHSMDEVLDFVGDFSGYPALKPVAEKYFEDRFENDYVIVRYFVAEKSTGGEVEDALAAFFAWDLVEIQSQPAWDYASLPAAVTTPPRWRRHLNRAQVRAVTNWLRSHHVRSHR